MESTSINHRALWKTCAREICDEETWRFQYKTWGWSWGPLWHWSWVCSWGQSCDQSWDWSWGQFLHLKMYLELRKNKDKDPSIKSNSCKLWEHFLHFALFLRDLIPIYVHIIYMILQDNYKERRQGREGEMLVFFRTGGQDFLNLTFIGKMSYLTDISSLFSSNSRQQ